MSQAESGGVSQQSSRLKNNTAPQLAAHEVPQDAAQRRERALPSAWGTLSATYRDPSTHRSCPPLAFASCLFVAQHRAQPLVFPNVHQV